MNHMERLTNEELAAELYRRSKGIAMKNDRRYREQEKELRSLSVKLREAEQGKSDFLSNVRNEINNPLTSILGLAESISVASKEDHIKRLGLLVHEQAFALDFQMRNIIIASEIEMGRVKPLIAQVRIASLLESQIDYLRLKIERAKAVIKLQVNEALIYASDSYLLQTIFVNLIANAIEFSGVSKTVHVKAWQEAHQLIVKVEDFGEGIAMEKQRLLFTRFKQLDAGSTRLHPGHGLGLAIVHELVGILGGKIELNSAEANGTSVVIRFPKPRDMDSTAVSSFGNEVIFTDGREF